VTRTGAKTRRDAATNPNAAPASVAGAVRGATIGTAGARRPELPIPQKSRCCRTGSWWRGGTSDPRRHGGVSAEIKTGDQKGDRVLAVAVMQGGEEAVWVEDERQFPEPIQCSFPYLEGKGYLGLLSLVGLSELRPPN